MKTKIVEQGEVRCEAAQSDHRATTQEMDMATHIRRAPFSHNPGPAPQVAMIHKFRIGESTEKRHVLPFRRATRRKGEFISKVMAGLVPAIHALLAEGRQERRGCPRQAIDKRGHDAGASETDACIPRSPVETTRTPGRNKIKATPIV
jgi:hypothetical protein